MIRHIVQRLIASARSGSWGLRKRAAFRVNPVIQNGVVLLKPRDPSLMFWFVPACLVAVAAGVFLAVL